MKKTYFFMAAVFMLTFCCFVTVNGQTTPSQDDQDTVYTRAEVDKQAVISRKPRPETGGRCGRGSSGTVMMNLILRKDGTVEIASVPQTSGCSYFDESSNQAARAIKFAPAEKDGKPVSVRTIVQFNYRTY
jgi:TonB family protein